MLQQLLSLIGRGGVQQPTSLAAELAVPVTLVEQMLGDLERMGYLQIMGGDCSSAACAHCATVCGVPAGNQARTWVLTAKGSRALRSSK